jgi:hypothetical protein
MRKRILALLLVFITVAALLPVSALAYTHGELRQARAIVNEANEQIADVVEFFQNSPLPGFIAAPMAKHITDGIAERAIYRCAKLGVEVKCVEVETVIKGYTVMIDPLIVISL